MAPIRHPAPAGELRLEWPGKCWVWAQAEGAFTSRHETLCELAAVGDTICTATRYGWTYLIRTRGPRPPWPTFIDQRDPGDERVEDDGFITVWPGPSEGFTQQGARG